MIPLGPTVDHAGLHEEHHHIVVRAAHFDSDRSAVGGDRARTGPAAVILAGEKDTVPSCAPDADSKPRVVQNDDAFGILDQTHVDQVLPLETAENFGGIGHELVEVFCRSGQGEAGHQGGEEDFAEVFHGSGSFLGWENIKVPARRPRPQDGNQSAEDKVSLRIKVGAISAVNSFSICTVWASFLPSGKKPSVTIDITIT